MAGIFSQVAHRVGPAADRLGWHHLRICLSKSPPKSLAGSCFLARRNSVIGEIGNE